jgi:hypothetical protein
MTKNELNLAKIGITALIDEGTGYQEVRPSDELQKKYDQLLVDALRKSREEWVKKGWVKP